MKNLIITLAVIFSAATAVRQQGSFVKESSVSDRGTNHYFRRVSTTVGSLYEAYAVGRLTTTRARGASRLNGYWMASQKFTLANGVPTVPDDMTHNILVRGTKRNTDYTFFVGIDTTNAFNPIRCED